MNEASPPGAPGSRVRSFTLIEVLVSLGVFSLLLLFVASMTVSTSRIADTTGRHADVADEAREVLDRMGSDISAMLLRPDVDAIFANQDGNDALFFYSQAPGYFSGVDADNQSPVSLVGYRITTTEAATPKPVLERLAMGIAWSGPGAMNFLTVGPPSSLTAPEANPGPTNSASTIAGQWGSVIGAPPYDQGTSAYYHALGGQVFRLEFCFLHKDGTYSTTPGSLTNTAAIAIAIALLDDKSRLLVQNFNGVVSALPDVTDSQLSSDPPVLMEESWNQKLVQAGFAQNAGIPAAAASQIRVFQRLYYLNLPPAK